MSNPAKQKHFSRRALLGGSLAIAAGGALSFAWLKSTSGKAMAAPGSPTSNSQPVYAQGQTLFANDSQPGFVQSLSWSPNGQRLATAGAGSLISAFSALTWDALTGKHVVMFNNPAGGPISSVRWSPEGNRIASGTMAGATIWNPSNGAPLLTYTGHLVPSVGVVEWSPDGKRCASISLAGKRKGAQDYRVHVWDSRTAAQLLTYDGHTATVLSLTWSPDGRYLASGGLDNTVQVWDSHTGARVQKYLGHTQLVTSVAWSPAGNWIASASADTTVQVWNPWNGQTYNIYRGHSASVSSVDWSPKGQALASGSWDQSVQLWKPDSKKPFYRYTGQNGSQDYVFGVAWSPNGRLLADCTSPFNGLEQLPTNAQTLVWASGQ